MENIVYHLFDTNIHNIEPGLHYLSYEGQTDGIMSHYMHVHIMYEHLNRVRYTTLELNSTSQSCSTFQFHAGYQTGGKDKLKTNTGHEHSICTFDMYIRYVHSICTYT